MPRIVDNAEIYAATRVGIFFPGSSNGTGADGDLTGQCVTLNKWFLAEMTDVPAPFSARGDARYVGQTLVRQGHATQVPYEQRRRGDFAVFEYGQYGHIGVLLDADRIFEQNANVGVARKLVAGAWVYASRVGRLSESWRTQRATIYRINSYREGSMSVDKLSREDVIEIHRAYFIGDPGAGYGWEHVGQPLSKIVADFKNSIYRKNVTDRYFAFDQNQQTINSLNAQLQQLNESIQKLTSDDATDKARIAELQAIADNTAKTIEELTVKNNDLAAEAAKYKDDIVSSEKAGNAFVLWLGGILKKLMGKE